MKKPIVKLGFFVLLLVSFFGCKDITDQYIYKRPSWLEGKLYTQMSKRDDLSLFTQGIARTRYKDVLDRSGYFTVFAPTDDAMKAYLTEKGYASVDDIPVTTMEGIVRYHTLQNGWNLEQLKFFSRGWIEPEQAEDYYLNYKRTTISEDTATMVTWGNDQFTKGVKRRNMLLSTGRKFISIYYAEALKNEKLTLADYGLFTNRTIESESDIYYGYSKVLEVEIPAENGFVYIVDKVMEPAKTVRQHMESRDNGQSYSKMLALFDEFRLLTPDFDATNAQEGASTGKDIDTLYTSNYLLGNSSLGFNIDREEDILSLSYIAHSSAIIPNDAAFNELMNRTYLSKEYPNHHANLKTVPLILKREFLRSFVTLEGALASNLDKGILTESGDSITKEDIPNEVITEKVLCSNGYFIGVNMSYTPRLLASVTGPVVMRTGYTYMLYAMDRARLLTSLLDKSSEFTLFTVSDNTCDNDSSFIAEFATPESILPYYWKWDFINQGQVIIPQADIKGRMKNQVVFGTYKRQASVEFLPTLGGNYIKSYERNDSLFAEGLGVSQKRVDYTDIMDPADPDDDSTYLRFEPREIFLEKLEEPTDNGEVFAASNWFEPGSSNLYSRLNGYSEFMKLLKKCGLAIESTTRLTFISSNRQYTGFIPSDEALKDFQADTITNMNVLRMLLAYHFVGGEIILTDGNAVGGAHKSIVSADGQFLEIPMELGPDKIILLRDVDDQTDDYDVIMDNAAYSEEIYAGSDNVLRDNLIRNAGLMKLNVFSVISSGTSTSAYDNKTQAVTHKIDVVLVPSVLKSYFYQ